MTINNFLIAGTIPMVAMEELSLPQLIVPASHTALSRDLPVMILDLPAVTPLEIPEILKTTTTNLPIDEDISDYDLDKDKDEIQTPYILRFV